MSSRKKKASPNQSENQPEKQSENQAENQSEEQSENRSHKYDASFKGWMVRQAPVILPILVPGVEYEREVNVEVIPPVMRTDKVFQVHYEGVRQILHIEFETGSDTELPSRLMVYNAMLHYKHKCPVATIVIYPFETALARSPYVVGSEERKILTFEFNTLPLFEMEARLYVEQHQTCMYPLLLTMPDVHPDLMEQVMRELSEMYRDDRKTFSDQVAWMLLLLERNDGLDEVVKSQIRERVKMFEQLWEESPTVQKMRAQYYEKGKIEEREKGLQDLQSTLVDFVQVRFPELTEFAQRQAQFCKRPDVLRTVTRQLFANQESGTAQKLLESLSES